ncbi:hypothetical protein P43SY_002916 [Pythium insidiosum]|uniref:Pescadillo homolog n=1 Tax=Pythium insidiosum TaxID=114742 RepID=A0AAD5M4Z4_PYTIN|nr:hypothetical protein P43SY_002916 [Pythium insidiosum]
MPTKRVKGKKKLKSIKAKQTNGMGSTRRRAKLGKEQRKGMKGSAANYMTRSQALRKLQITLKDFRRLCILKGIYPRDPKKKPKGKDKTYYYVKDVMYLAHEPVLDKFREFKTFMKKVKRAMGKKHYGDAMRIHENRPQYSIDHIVKERYPRFADALGDLDDALCLVHLFAVMPAERGIEAEVTEQCLKLVREWQNYIVASRSLTKVFVSIKGIYYQASVHGQPVTWLVPHQFTPTADQRVDFRVMLTFLEFYTVLLKFVNFQLYTELGVAYPPKINLQLDQAGAQLAALELERVKKAEDDDSQEHDADADAAAAKKPEVTKQQKESERRIKTLADSLNVDALGDDEDDDDAEARYGEMSEPLEAAFASNKLAQQIYSEQRKEASEKGLFSGLNFFLSREVPAAPLEFVLRSHGATIGWCGEGSPYVESSDRVTHHVMDRPHQGHRYFNREYIQPQWVFDSVNNGIRLPIARYAPGADLPPHLSPFVDDAAEGYVPDYRKELNKLKSAAQVLREAGDDDAMDVPGAANSDEEEEDEEQAYAAGIKAEREGKAASDSEEEDDDEDDDDSEEEEEEEEEKPQSSKRKAAAETAAPAAKKSKKEKQEEEAAELHEMAVNMMSKKARRLYDRMQFGLGKKSDKIKALEDKKAQLDAAKQQQQKQASASSSSAAKKRKSKQKN